MKRLQVAVARFGTQLFRNNVGTCRADDGRVVRFGLCKGSSDLIGWTPYVVQPRDVGRTLAVFTAVETKTATGWVREEQEKFINRVRAAGGYACVAREGETAEQVLERMKA